MKKRLNRTQQTRFLLYLIYFLILGILLLVGKLKLNYSIILFLVVEIIFHKYKSWRNKRFYHASINIVDKMTGEEFEEFCDMLKQAAEVFKTSKSKYFEKYNALYQKHVDGTILPEEEEELQAVFKILRAYGDVDDISSQFLTTKVDQALDAVLGKLDKLLNK